jgi:hypothetical protein
MVVIMRSVLSIRMVYLQVPLQMPPLMVPQNVKERAKLSSPST